MRTRPLADGRHVDAAKVRALLEALIEPGERACLEGNNQKQPDFLAKALASLDATKGHDLHMLQSVIALPGYRPVRDGIASRLDFSFSGLQGARSSLRSKAASIGIPFRLTQSFRKSESSVTTKRSPVAPT